MDDAASRQATLLAGRRKVRAISVHDPRVSLVSID
jgi:hypothetical protein